ncbi:IQ-DOMAIN 14-like protein [Tanacetum coccineum]
MTTNDSKAWLHCGTEVVQRAMPIAEAKSRARLKHLERIHSQLDFELSTFLVLVVWKAPRVLKGLVKFQALVRGFLVRKRVAATLYSMQALLRAQLAV